MNVGQRVQRVPDGVLGTIGKVSATHVEINWDVANRPPLDSRTKGPGLRTTKVRLDTLHTSRYRLLETA